MPLDRRRKKKSSVIEHPPALRLHRHRRAGFSSERTAASDTKDALASEESLLCRGSLSFLPSFLPFCHFLTMYFPLLVSRANNGQKRGRNIEGERRSPREREKSARKKKTDSAHPFLHLPLFPSLHDMYICTKRWGKRKRKGTDGRTIEGSIEERERRQQDRINWR